MDNLPVYSYPDEVARKWKAERDMLAKLAEAALDANWARNDDFTAEEMALHNAVEQVKGTTTHLD